MTMTGCPDLDESIRSMRGEALHLRRLNQQTIAADPVKDYGTAGARRFQRADVAANFRGRGEKLVLHPDGAVAGRALLMVTRIVNDLFRMRRREPSAREVMHQVRMARQAAEQDLEDIEADLAEAQHLKLAAERRIASAAAVEDYMNKSAVPA
jgi:hypothetical protein